MLKSKELRAKAWNSLKGKYWKAFLVVLVLGAIVSVGTGLLSCFEGMMDIVDAVDPSEMDSTMELGAIVLLAAASVSGIVGLLINIFVTKTAKDTIVE